MDGSAIICEFNPFHYGHKYLLRQARKSGAGPVVCIMSGNFVQRAEPAITDKIARTLTALDHGADAVVQLPTAFAVADAQTFAAGAVRTIKALGLKRLVCGAESDADFLMRAAAVQADEDSAFKAALKSAMKNGACFAAAIASATAARLSYPAAEGLLKLPNNILAVSYLRASLLENARLEPVIIRRKGSGYNETSLPEEGFASAAALRKEILRGNENLEAFMPPLKSGLRPDFALFARLAAYDLRFKDLHRLKDCGEGIEIKLKKCAAAYTSLNDILAATKSKRYTMTRLKRLCLQAMLDINNDINMNITPMARLLGLNKTYKDILSHLPANIYLQVSELSKTDAPQKRLLEIDAKADSLFAFLCNSPVNQFYRQRFILK